MVYNTTRHVRMPFTNGTMSPHLRRLKLGNKIEGEGMGSVLLEPLVVVLVHHIWIWMTTLILPVLTPQTVKEHNV